MPIVEEAELHTSLSKPALQGLTKPLEESSLLTGDGQRCAPTQLPSAVGSDTTLC